MFRATSHRLLLAAVGLLIFGQIVALWPSSTPRETPDVNAPESPGERMTRFQGFQPPTGMSPDYSIRNFRYVSVSGGKKQWQLAATEAQIFSSKQTVLTTDVQAELFSGDRSQTPSVRVTGKEARYSTGTRILEVGGTVVAHFPDGSEIHSEYLKFDPTRRIVVIPMEFAVFGRGPSRDRTQIEFRSLGLDGALDNGRFTLPRKVEIRVLPSSPSSGQSPAIFHAARAELFRNEGLAQLYSGPIGSNEEYVRLEHPGPTDLFARSRSMEVHSSSQDKQKKPSFTALDDVRIEEWNRDLPRTGKPYRYSTSGRAEFHPDESEFILTEYPQVYQGEDTMTGDLVRVDRKNDRVEVENTNAISKGRYD
jgi:LPS export ABC transporter protein LptC